MPVTRRSEANPDLDQAVRNLRAACVSRAWAYRPDVLAVLAVLEESAPPGADRRA